MNKKENLLLLHGALGSEAQFTELIILLDPEFNVHALNFSGHGGSMPETGFSIRQFAGEAKNFITNNRLERVSIFGYSMGGYVALAIALEHPEIVHKIITLATKFHWTKESAEKESKMLIPEVIEEKIPKFAETLRQRHAPADWKEVMKYTSEMMRQLGDGEALTPEDFQRIHHEVLLCLGAEDNMVTHEETLDVARALPNATFQVIEGLKHPIESAPKEQLANIILAFLKKK